MAQTCFRAACRSVCGTDQTEQLTLPLVGDGSSTRIISYFYFALTLLLSGTPTIPNQISTQLRGALRTPLGDCDGGHVSPKFLQTQQTRRGETLWGPGDTWGLLLFTTCWTS